MTSNFYYFLGNVAGAVERRAKAARKKLHQKSFARQQANRIWFETVAQEEVLHEQLTKGKLCNIKDG